MEPEQGQQPGFPADIHVRTTEQSRQQASKPVPSAHSRQRLSDSGMEQVSTANLDTTDSAG
jgi:hypothetical protein